METEIKQQTQRALRAFALQEHSLFVERSSSMKILTTRGELIWAMKWLKSQFPGSLSLYLVVDNILHNRFTWPGMELVVDEWPCISACAWRPARRKMNKEYVAMLYGKQMYVHASRAQEFAALLDKALDRTFNVTFAGVDTKLAESAQSDVRLRGITLAEAAPSAEACFLFYLRSSSFRGHCLGRMVIPEIFRVGKLSVKNVDLVTRTYSYGNPESKRDFFHYLLTQNFPSVAFFDKNAESDDPIAYCMYLQDGAISEIYVHPAYVKYGLHKLVLAHMLMRLRFLGIARAWMPLTNRSTPAETGAIRDLAGKSNNAVKEFKDHHKCWLSYRSRYVQHSPTEVEVNAQRGSTDGGPSTVVTRENFDDHPDQHTSKKYCQETAIVRKELDAGRSTRNKKKFKSNRRFIKFSSTHDDEAW